MSSRPAAFPPGTPAAPEPPSLSRPASLRELGAEGVWPEGQLRLRQQTAQARLAQERPSIKEIDLTPFAASADPADCLALNARIVLAPPPAGLTSATT